MRNTGTEYAREIANLAFNIHIGDDPNPVYTYFVAADLGGDGALHNFLPGEEHTYTARHIPLTLEQMAIVDLGGPMRVVVEEFSYGIDELFYQDAANAGVMLAMEDGTDDGDESIDTYLIPTWGAETVLDVLARYFPHETDADGMMIAIWTPEYRADTPGWCVEPATHRQHSLVQACALHRGLVEHLLRRSGRRLGRLPGHPRRPPARPHSSASTRTPTWTVTATAARIVWALIRMIRLVSPARATRRGAQHPQRQRCRGTLSLLNTGLYDAYGVEAVMIAPDDSVTITNSVVGGSGRVRAQKQVIVGSRILLQSPLPPPGCRPVTRSRSSGATILALPIAPTPSPPAAPTGAAAMWRRARGR